MIAEIVVVVLHSLFVHPAAIAHHWQNASVQPHVLVSHFQSTPTQCPDAFSGNHKIGWEIFVCLLRCRWSSAKDVCLPQHKNVFWCLGSVSPCYWEFVLTFCSWPGGHATAWLSNIFCCRDYCLPPHCVSQAWVVSSLSPIAMASSSLSPVGFG